MKKLFLFALCATLTLLTQSCQKDAELQNTDAQAALGKSKYAEAIAAEDLPSPETAPYVEHSSFNAVHGTEQTGWLAGQEIRYYAANDSMAVIDGDVLIPQSAIKKDRNALETRAAVFYSGSRPWLNNTVYYQLDAQLPTNLRTSFGKACYEWNRLTGIRFVQRTSTTQTNYIYVFKGNGNYSTVGMIGGGQELSLNDPNVGVAIHELGHALGMIHEHQRSDRNDHLIVHSSVANTDNFSRYVSSTNYGAFSWSSIMLYPSKQFSNGSYDMVRRNDGRPFPNNIETAKAQNSYALPSTNDVALIRSIYR
jgi:hypothetical protein